MIKEKLKIYFWCWPVFIGVLENPVHRKKSPEEALSETWKSSRVGDSRSTQRTHLLGMFTKGRPLVGPGR